LVETSGTHRSGPSAERSELPVPCDLVTVPARQGLEAVDLLRHGSGVGPVLHDRTGASLCFLVPPGTADGWDVPGSSCTRTDGRGLVLAADPTTDPTAEAEATAEADPAPNPPPNPPVNPAVNQGIHPDANPTTATPSAPVRDGGWLVPPHTDTAVTDPAVLRAALGQAARMIELADSYQGRRR
jgi:hypothetical protein